jgi:hypothetical protein
MRARSSWEDGDADLAIGALAHEFRELLRRLIHRAVGGEDVPILALTSYAAAGATTKTDATAREILAIKLRLLMCLLFPLGGKR